MADRITEEEWAAAEAAQPRTPDALAGRFHAMRQKIAAGPHHGVTRDQVAELLDGKNGTQLRAVAAFNGIDVDHRLTAPEVARLIIDRAVGDALDSQSAAPPRVGRPPLVAAPRGQRASAPASVDDDPTAPAAVSRWDADQGRMDYGKVIGHAGFYHTVEWADGHIEHIDPEDHRYSNLTILTAEQRRRETEMRIRDGYDRLAEKKGDGVGLRQIRETMPDVPKEEFDAAAYNVMQHSDVNPDPLLPLPHAFSKRTTEDFEHGVPFGGSTMMTIRMDERRGYRGGKDDAERWRSSDADSVASYVATLNEIEVRRLAENLDVTPSEDPEVTAKRIVETSARNRDEWIADAKERTADLTTLHEAERATENGYGPETWTPEERAEVAKAAHRQADNEWEPGRKRAAKFAALPEDGTLGEVWREKAKDRDEELFVRKAARDTGQVYIDHGLDGTEQCAAGRRHAGPCPPQTPGADANCKLCDTDDDVNPSTGVCRRCTSDRAAYDGQPFKPGDMTGIPPHIKQRCGKCRKDMAIRGGTQSFDADGSAQVDTFCDTCKISSGVTWVWSTGTSPACDEDLCDDCDRNPRLGHAAHCSKPERDAIAERFAGAAPAQLELKFDDIVRLHREMMAGLGKQLDQRAAVAKAVGDAGVSIDGMEDKSAELIGAAYALSAAMQEAQLDTSSADGAVHAAEVLTPEDIGAMIDALDIISDLTYESTGRVQDAYRAVNTSADHVEQTYGAIAAGIQETGVSGAALEGTGTAN